MEKSSSKYDLQARTFEFSKDIVRLCRSIKFDPIISKIIDQLVRSGTSIGANYMEAVNASSKKDFKNKLFICKKEAQETGYWLNLLRECENSSEVNCLSQECHELNLIFQKSINTLNEQNS